MILLRVFRLFPAALMPPAPVFAPVIAPVIALGITIAPVAGLAQSQDGLSWSAQKCVLYESAVGDALQMLGRAGIREGFLEQNARFIAGGCVADADICPKTAREFDLVNLLTVMTMNEGMASTFVPFACTE